MPTVNPCPEQNAYQRLLHGDLPPSDVERLSQHLAGCSSCAAAVQTLLGEDTLLSAIRGMPVDGPTGAEVPADLTRRLLALPAQSPAGPTALASLLAPPQAPDEIGRLAHYRVLKVLGQGGMGVVFLAEDTLLGRAVALKTMKPEVAANPQHRQRFLREARAAAKVENDHIVPIYGVGEDRGVPWLAMPFLKGQSLDQLLKRLKVLQPAQAVRLGTQVAKGLAAAHAAGLIHRDVKPANIWVEPEGGGRAKLLDFGLARDARPDRDRGEQLTRTGAVLGTPAFMAPEQAQGEPLDPRADLFSLGCVLYRAVTGQLPFQGQGMISMLLAVVTETPPAPHAVNPAVPPPLSALIMNLLAKDRSARPASAAIVAAALEGILEKPAGPVPVAIPVAPRQEQGNPWAGPMEVTVPEAPVVAPRRRWRLATAAALLLALGGALAAGIVVILENKDGTEVARVPVPDGGSAEIKQDRDSGKPKVEPVDSNPDRRAAEWVLKIGGSVTIRVAENEQDVKAVKDLPARPFQLTRVGFWDNRNVTNAGLENLKGLTNLTHFSLGYCWQVDDAGVKHLKGLTSLQDLNLRDTKVSDAGLEHFKGLTNLTHLSLPWTGVTGTGFVHLKELNNLTYLDLWSSPGVTGPGLEHLQQLTVLQLGNTKVSDAGLEHLKGLKNLTVLGLNNTRVSDAGLVHLKGLTKLTSLALNDTRVSDAGLRDLVNLPLTVLFLENSRLSARGFANFPGAFPGVQVTGKPRPSLAEDLLAEGATLLIRPVEGKEDLLVRKIADLPREPFLVRRADCTGVKKPPAELLARLSQWREVEFERLEALDVSGCAIDNLSFAPPLESLQELNVSGTKVGDLQPVFGLKRLRKLSLDRVPVSDLGLIPKLTNLEELSLAGTPIADAALQALEDLPNLRKLDLDQTGVTGRGLGYLAKLPKLAELSLAGSKVSDLLAAEVGALTKLERLSLAGCTFSDAGLKHLPGMSNLKELDLTGTQVTADGVAALQKALPKCRSLSGPAAK